MLIIIPPSSCGVANAYSCHSSPASSIKHFCVHISASPVTLLTRIIVSATLSAARSTRIVGVVGPGKSIRKYPGSLSRSNHGFLFVPELHTTFSGSANCGNRLLFPPVSVASFNVLLKLPPAYISRLSGLTPNANTRPSRPLHGLSIHPRDVTLYPISPPVDLLIVEICASLLPTGAVKFPPTHTILYSLSQYIAFTAPFSPPAIKSTTFGSRPPISAIPTTFDAFLCPTLSKAPPVCSPITAIESFENSTAFANGSPDDSPTPPFSGPTPAPDTPIKFPTTTTGVSPLIVIFATFCCPHTDRPPSARSPATRNTLFRSIYLLLSFRPFITHILFMYLFKYLYLKNLSCS
ncbi:hypothetical protein AX774_g1646 [Zancudomyces culisetae]|uniref:Uncharacterized protein n=1 Tax=Zancudomyces culisetae TaxID=1213189 RepID=A0A1R1PV56_ZANCU|nr:hypothetical protein AX774_g1646 [Zancudomyces culisetae]|eukprot:OMH84813.1 hypothetical protein AX774_g1646 [Zancudomyces culisetae]